MSKEDIAKGSQVAEESKTWHEVDIKVETEVEADAEIDSEIKEPMKNEVELPPKPETTEHRLILDVDKFEPIESDEDDTLLDRLDIKTEIETSEDKSMEALQTYKQEPISEDSKSQDNVDTQSSMDDMRQLVNTADFDLDDSRSGSERLNKSEVSLLSNVLPKNEIEDIQQKLHSFHSENLMILSARNKKRASRATTPTSDDIPNSSGIASKDSFLASSSSSSDAAGLKSRRFSSDENHEFKLEPDMQMQLNEDESAYGQYQTDAVLQSNAAAMGQLIPSSHSYSYSMSRIEPNQTVSAIPIYQTAPPPSFPNSALGGSIQPSNSLYHYLENPNSRTSAYSAGYSSAPPHMFTMNTSVPPPTLLNSSNYLTKSYTTLSEPSTPVSSLPPPSPVSVAPSSSLAASATTPVNPKVLARTQSADPRLNPPKDLPPVTPKRKLSINEYRKRKQLSTDREKPKAEKVERTETPAESTKDLISDDKPKNGMAAVADTTKDTGKICTDILHHIDAKKTNLNNA